MSSFSQQTRLVVLDNLGNMALRDRDTMYRSMAKVFLGAANKSLASEEKIANKVLSLCKQSSDYRLVAVAILDFSPDVGKFASRNA
jgi:hypothetical protein